MKFEVTNLFSILAVVVVFLACGSTTFGQDVTPKQKQAVKKIATSIDRAGKQFKSKKYAQSAKHIDTAMTQLDSIREVTPELLELLQPEYERLSKAHKLLSENGQKLRELKELPTAMSDGGGGEMISFCLLYTSPSPRDRQKSRMPSSA